MRGWRSHLNSTLQGIPDMLNNVHVWGVWGPAEVFKLRTVFLKPLCSNPGHVGCCIGLLELPNGHEWMQVISQDAYIRVTCQSCISGVPYHSNCTHPTPLQSLHQLEQSSADMQVHGFMKLSPYPYTSVCSIQLKIRLVRPVNMFPVINSPMSVLTGPGEV